MIQVHTCEQGSAEWFQARLGLPTASMFAPVMASGKGAGPSLTRKTYLYKLAGEIITGEPADNFSNGHMDRGHAMEGTAREYYAFLNDVDPELVGFVTNGPKGCSPDALVGDAGLLEIKTALAHIQIERLLRGDLPPEHKAQCQGALWVCEREWLDFCSYWPKCPPLIVRVTRDEDYIRELAGAVDAFNEELAQIVARVRACGLQTVGVAA